jgi:hypothetical protein
MFSPGARGKCASKSISYSLLVYGIEVSATVIAWLLKGQSLTICRIGLMEDEPTFKIDCFEIVD